MRPLTRRQLVKRETPTDDRSKFDVTDIAEWIGMIETADHAAMERHERRLETSSRAQRLARGQQATIGRAIDARRKVLGEPTPATKGRGEAISGAQEC